MLFTACHKDDFEPFTPTHISIVDTTAQYGTPFANVPDIQDAIIYQVNIRSFSTGGKFTGVTARLDSIKALGVNVIYLMPIYPIGVDRSVNSPYSIRDYRGVATQMGTLEELRALIDGAHQRNMAVIFDWVANHTAWDNPWIVNKSWYQLDAGGNIIAPPNTNYSDVAQLNFNNADMRLAMIRNMQYWIYKANIDGYRCDYADPVPLDFWKQALDSLRGITSHKLIMLAEGGNTNYFSVGFDLKYTFQFFSNLKGVFGSNGAATSIDPIVNTDFVGSTGSNQQPIHYTSNHDVNLLEGTPNELFGGDNGAIAAFVAAAYSRGIPMIYNGQEINYNTRLEYFNTNTPIDWTPKPVITGIYKKLIAFRKNSEALKTGTQTAYSNNDIYAFTRIAGSEKVLVLVNVRNANKNFTVPTALANTNWQDAFTNASFSLGATGTTINIPAYGYIVVKQ